MLHKNVAINSFCNILSQLMLQKSVALVCCNTLKMLLKYVKVLQQTTTNSYCNTL